MRSAVSSHCAGAKQRRELRPEAQSKQNAGVRREAAARGSHARRPRRTSPGPAGEARGSLRSAACSGGGASAQRTRGAFPPPSAGDSGARLVELVALGLAPLLLRHVHNLLRLEELLGTSAGEQMSARLMRWANAAETRLLDGAVGVHGALGRHQQAHAVGPRHAVLALSDSGGHRMVRWLARPRPEQSCTGRAAACARSGLGGRVCGLPDLSDDAMDDETAIGVVAAMAWKRRELSRWRRSLVVHPTDARSRAHSAHAPAAGSLHACALRGIGCQALSESSQHARARTSSPAWEAGCTPAPATVSSWYAFIATS